MILLNMASEQLEQRILGKIYDEIIDHMKRSGEFDEVRVGLIDPIWSDPDFEKIIQKFEMECEQFCERADLSLNRNLLRSQLAARFDYYSSSGRMVKTHISQLLEARNQELKTKYYEHAGNFLKKFLPLDTEPEPFREVQAETPVDIKQETEIDTKPDIQIDIKPDTHVDVKNDTHIEVQSYNQIENQNETNVEMQNDIQNDLQNDNHIDMDADIDMDISSVSSSSSPSIERPMYSPIGEDATEELEQLTFSSVSSVNTADLSDFDNSIKLSDDEANIVGKPKNSKVPIEVIQGSIKDLQTTSVECKQEQTEPVDASESDGGCSESTTGRRLARTRKSNPRYSNEHYKLL